MDLGKSQCFWKKFQKWRLEKIFDKFYAECKSVMLRKCAKSFYSKRIRFVAFATKPSSYINSNLGQICCTLWHNFIGEG